MTLEPSERITKLTEKYHLGKLRVPDYEAGGKMDIGVLVIYTKETDELERKPVRECARFMADCYHDYFTGRSIYGGYVKYTPKNGSAKRMFLSLAGRGEYAGIDEEIEPKKLADPTIVDTEQWDKNLLALIDQLPEPVRDLFRFPRTGSL